METTFVIIFYSLNILFFQHRGTILNKQKCSVKVQFLLTLLKATHVMNKTGLMIGFRG